MEERTSYLVVGAFLLLAIAMTVAFSVWIAGGPTTDSTSSYTILFERDVSGLTLGSPVRFLGVDVGEVASMELITGQATQVSVEISVVTATPIHTGTYASLSYQGITGVAFINLAADPGRFPPLSVGGSGGNPIITARDVGLAAVFAQSGRITAEVDMLLDQANSLLGERNQASLSRTLANAELLTDTLMAERETLAAVPQRLLDALDDLHSVTTAVQKILDEAQPDLLSTTEQLRRVTADTAQLMQGIGTWFGSNEASLESFVADGLGEFPGLVAETRGTLRQLDKVLMDVRENPSQLIYQPQSTAVQVEP